MIADERAKWPQDIFIPKSYTESAIDGDLVNVAVNTNSSSEKGPEGKILSILKRAHSQLAGTICAVHSSRELAAHVPLLGNNKPIVIRSSPSISCKIGDRVILRVDEWGAKEKPTICTVSQIIGNIIDPSCDVRATTLEFNLRSDFPENVITEAKGFGNKIKVSDLKSRMDLTGVTCFTMDPDTAKDFDDALSLTKDEKGHFYLGVHIADVAHYVKTNSPLDQEAFLRANSTYFPGACVPMLPEELWITHDLSIVSQFCDYVMVMYAGQVIESSNTKKLFSSPLHPYTQKLLQILPQSRLTPFEPIAGFPPDLSTVSPGCSFCARCDQSMRICFSQTPALKEIEQEQLCACFRYDPRKKS